MANDNIKEEKIKHDAPWQHLNGNILCAVDTETTGLIPFHHDVIQVAVLPLNTHLEPMQWWNGKKVLPFYMRIKPSHPENVDPGARSVHGLDPFDSNAIDPWQASELFERWFESFNLGPKKKITPLGMNYQFDLPFIADWLGGMDHYAQFFHHHYRDLMVGSLTMNDIAYNFGAAPPYPMVSLKRLACVHDISHERGHDALEDCLVTARCYKKMISRSSFI